MRERADEAGPELAAAAAVLVYAVLIARLVPDVLYVPVNLLAAAAFILFGRWAGATAAEMGLERDRLAAGLRVGLIALLPIAALVALGIAVPTAHRFFANDPLANVGAGRAAYEVFVRIPLGTALAEELIFRGALLGLFLRRHSRWTAATLSSLLYGLWHVLPTISSLEHEYAGKVVGTSVAARSGAVAGAVLATAAAGYAFCWLRYRARSVLAPILAHAFLNGSAAAAGRMVHGS